MDVLAWLTGLGLAHHAPAFSEQRITAEVLPDLTDEHLRALGVTALGERKRLLAAAAACAPRRGLGVSKLSRRAIASRPTLRSNSAHTTPHRRSPINSPPALPPSFPSRVLLSRHLTRSEGP